MQNRRDSLPVVCNTFRRNNLEMSDIPSIYQACIKKEAGHRFTIMPSSSSGLTNHYNDRKVGTWYQVYIVPVACISKGNPNES